MKSSLSTGRRIVVAIALTTILGAVACARAVNDDADPLASFAPNTGATGQACVETKCPSPFATCPGGGACTTNLTNDVDHCGACGAACPRTTRQANGTYLCSEGQCKIACSAFRADCNGLIADGCETPTYSDAKNCGGCGVSCAEGDLCWKGACGCPNGFTRCGDDCVQLPSDDLNCGACGKPCVAPTDDADPRWTCGPKVTPNHTDWKCGDSECKLQCEPGFADCNTNFCGDGCEIDLLHDPANCGKCGNACNDGQWCNEGTCSCPQGTVRCRNTCVDLLNDAANCGACGARCPGPSTARPGQPSTGGPLCVVGECTYVCKPGFADCDRDVSNGCEANLATDQRNCGACGTKCNVAAGQPCVAGACLTKACESGPGPR